MRSEPDAGARALHRPDARRMARTLLALGVLLGALLSLARPAAATSYVPISGDGSTWSQNALDQWRRDVQQYGMTVNYQGNGSTQGRTDFRNGQVDFGVSEIPYGVTDNGVTDPPPARHFAYMPIVAGGTSFMYNLQINGKQVTNLRLSGPNLTKIFTRDITMWNDPAIAADNPGLTLPARAIVPVVRSDGSGTTAQFTAWMAAQYPSNWDAFCGRNGRATPCGTTSIYPTAAGVVAQSTSLGVAGYVSQPGHEGTIGYVEYSYAVLDKFPVVKLLNTAGYYTEPTADSVAVGLLGATLNPDLTQNLSKVYSNTDPRAYPMSSYSYMILPTAVENGFSTAKGATLSAFANYFLCQGQQNVEQLGYSPLPINLVKAAFAQVAKIPGATAGTTDISKCNNPTFSTDGTNTVAKLAPQPPACDKQGSTQCATGTGGARTATPTAPAPPATGTTGTTGTATAGTKGTTGTAPTAPGATAPTGGVQSPTQITDAPGTTAQAGADASSDNTLEASSVQAVPVSLASDGAGAGTTTAVLALIAAALLIGLTVLPPLVSRRLKGLDR